MTTQVELKACPFCGAAAVTGPYPMDSQIIRCVSHECPAHPSVVGATLEAAARLWNRRASGERTELAEVLRGLKLRGVITDADVERLEREGVRHACV